MRKKYKRIAHFLPFLGCARRCVYCDQRSITGVGDVAFVSPEEIARALSTEPEPVELCFFGGSFASLPREQMVKYLDAVYTAPAGSIVTFSSYPGDFDGTRGQALVETLARYPIGTIELGVPSLDRHVLRACARDDDPVAVLRAIEMLRDAGFHLGVQLMTGLPGQSGESTLRDLDAIAHLMPSGAAWHLRVYPCLVLAGTELEARHRTGVYEPQSLEEAVRSAGAILLRACERGFLPIRVGLLEGGSLRNSVVAGPYHPAFGELARSEMTARALVAENPNGPWRIPKNKISQLTGHNKRGIRRMAELSGIPANQVEAAIFVA
ncbi:radical SAM protein [Synergistaceae bacterium OttesenSCG-928-I11]|nr:radical SAM protein [Synergistaceae bacterium OttesenSCG-928-I11]